jgi:hypothetical protein
MAMNDEDVQPDKTPPPKPKQGGEDEGSTEKEGDDGHLHDDQKSPAYKTEK